MDWFMLTYYYLALGLFFVPFFEEAMGSSFMITSGFPCNGRCRHESENHISLHRVQTKKLQHNEEQKERSGQT